jgi:hypothetical protein
MNLEDIIPKSFYKRRNELKVYHSGIERIHNNFPNIGLESEVSEIYLDELIDIGELTEI